MYITYTCTCVIHTLPLPLSPRTEDERDVFNEKPSKEEMMAATQVGGALRCHGYLCIV